MTDKKETGMNGQDSSQQVTIGFVQQLTSNKELNISLPDKETIRLLRQIDHKLGLILLHFDHKNQLYAAADLGSGALLQLIENLIATCAAQVAPASHRLMHRKK